MSPRATKKPAAYPSAVRSALAAAIALSASTADGGPGHPSALPAFTGAQGYGAMSAGGRGGRIIAVTTLADGGPGSLRSCIAAQ